MVGWEAAVDELSVCFLQLNRFCPVTAELQARADRFRVEAKQQFDAKTAIKRVGSAHASGPTDAQAGRRAGAEAEGHEEAAHSLPH